MWLKCAFSQEQTWFLARLCRSNEIPHVSCTIRAAAGQLELRVCSVDYNNLYGLGSTTQRGACGQNVRFANEQHGFRGPMCRSSELAYVICTTQKGPSGQRVLFS